MAKIPLPTRDSIPEEYHARWDRTASRGPMLDIQRLFFVNPGIEVNALGAWRASGLSDRSREIVILRCAARMESVYEWHQHVRIARGVGLTDAEITAVRGWQDATFFSADERALLAYVDDLATLKKPADAVYDAFAKGRTPAEIFCVTYLITLYFQLARVMAVMELEPEAPFVGWELG